MGNSLASSSSELDAAESRYLRLANHVQSVSSRIAATLVATHGVRNSVFDAKRGISAAINLCRDGVIADVSRLHAASLRHARRSKENAIDSMKDAAAKSESSRMNAATMRLEVHLESAKAHF